MPKASRRGYKNVKDAMLISLAPFALKTLQHVLDIHLILIEERSLFLILSALKKTAFQEIISGPSTTRGKPELTFCT